MGDVLFSLGLRDACFQPAYGVPIEPDASTSDDGGPMAQPAYGVAIDGGPMVQPAYGVPVGSDG